MGGDGRSVPAVSRQRLPAYDEKKTPGSFLPGAFLIMISVGRLGSEVALNADVQADSVLVLVLVDRGRLRSSRGQKGRADELLVKMEPHHFRRERQVLDGSPAGDQTELRDVVVGVAAVVCARIGQLDGRVVVGTPLTLPRGEVGVAAAVPNRSVGAEQAGRPVGIPVVVECTTDTVRGNQLDIAARREDAVGSLAEADALVRARARCR